MIRGGGHPDSGLTAAAQFKDQRSYVRADGAEFLFGQDWLDRRAQVWRKDRHCCRLCGRQLALFQGECDHIKPRSLGGDDRIENLRFICPTSEMCDGGGHRGPQGRHA